MEKQNRSKIYMIMVVFIALIAVIYFTEVVQSGWSTKNALAEQSESAEVSSLVVKMIKDLSAEQQAEVIARNGGVEVSNVPALRLHIIEVPAETALDILARYKSDPLVESAELNMKRKAEGFLTDAYYTTQQWVLDKIGWEMVYDTYMPSGTATVAVLDTGVNASHPDLAGRVIPGISILDGSDGLQDQNGHGTWLAGIIAANTDNGEGLAGIAYSGVNIMPVTVLSPDGTGQDSDIIAGVVWAADNGADVILMSFSNPGFSSSLQDAIDYAWEKGVVLVAATGNDSLNTPTFPAGDRGVIGVSATDNNDNLAETSNYGKNVFLAAPGTNIVATNLNNDYTIINGTSPSAAIIAGAAAFMKAVDSALTNGVIVGRLARTADPAGTLEQTGNGRINMARALADTGTEEIQPAGADPIGDGGPYVGPYTVAATRNINFATSGLPAGVSITMTGSRTNPGGNIAPYSVTFSSSSTSSNIGTKDGTPFSYSGFPAHVTVSGITYDLVSTSPASGFTTPSGAGTTTVTATYQVACTAPSITVHPSTQTKTVGESVTFSVTATGTAPLSYQWRKGGVDIAGATNSSYTIGSVVTADAGNYTVYVSNACGNVTSNAATLTVNKATASVTLDNLIHTYDGTPKSATATTDATGSSSFTFTYDGSAIPPTDHKDGGYAVVATLVNDNYTGSQSGTLLINKAAATVTLDNLIHTYDGTPKSATATTDATGSSSFTFTYDGSATPPTDHKDGGYAVVATLVNDNYTGNQSGTLLINKATATISVVGYTGIYDGNPHGATGSATGVLGENLSGSLNLGATFTNVPGGTAHWTFTGGTNYNNADGDVAILIGKASATINVVGYTGVYDGNPHGATGSATGVLGEDLSGSLDLGATFTNVPGGTAHWTFSNLNYNDASGNVNIVISKATPTISWSNPADITYGTALSETQLNAVASVSGSFVYTPAVGTVLNAGNEQALHADFTPDDTVNYNGATKDVAINVLKAALTVTPDNKSKTLGLVFTDFTGSIVGIKNNDAITATYSSLGAEAAAAVGNYDITATLNDPDSKLNNYDVTYNKGTLSVKYASAEMTYGGQPSHTILQPINTDGTSVFKKGSTVPAKFRVCDAYGASIGTPGVASSFKLIQKKAGTTISDVNENVISTTPDTEFRWDSTVQQWIYNISTKNLTANTTYVYRITLNDGTWIDFQFGLK